MEYPKIQIVSTYYHSALGMFFILILVSMFWDGFNLPNNQIIPILAVGGILSLLINFFLKRDLLKYIEKTNSSLYEYKVHQINVKLLSIGIASIIFGIMSKSGLSILILSMGIYLIVNSLVDFLISRYLKSNILAIGQSKLINLNGGIRAIDLAKIKTIEYSSTQITLMTRFEKLTINEEKFVNSDGLRKQIKEITKNN